MSAQWHPDAEALARYRAGLAGGFRGRRLAAHIAGCARCTSVSEQLAAVSSLLASVPVPSMPDAAERRITAALAAEAAASAGAGAAGAGAGTADSARAGTRHARRFRLAMTAVPVTACLLLAGLGYLLSQLGGAPESASSASGAAAPAGRPAAASAGGAAAGGAGAGGAGAGGRAVVPGTTRQPAHQQPAAFVVVASGTSYRKATLGAQVRGELEGNAGGSRGISPGTAREQPGAGSAPPQALVGCVLHLTRDVPPRLVDKATYQGEPVYVIAVSGRAWVVGRTCTASHPALITSVVLPR
jgi:hypothetical protein